MNSHLESRCSWVRDRIESYIDRELLGDEALHFERHIDTCPNCERELELARSIVSELRAMPERKCPDHVTDRVFEEVGAEAGTSLRDRFRHWLAGGRLPLVRPVLVSALVLAVVVSSLLMGRFRSQRITPEEARKAEADLRLTFAYVSAASRRTGIAVRDDVIGRGLVEPMERAIHSTFERNPTPTQEPNGG